MLVVEQNVHQALAIADRGYVIESGRVIVEGRRGLEAQRDPRRLLPRSAARGRRHFTGGSIMKRTLAVAAALAALAALTVTGRGPAPGCRGRLRADGQPPRVSLRDKPVRGAIQRAGGGCGVRRQGRHAVHADGPQRAAGDGACPRRAGPLRGDVRARDDGAWACGWRYRRRAGISWSSSPGEFGTTEAGADHGHDCRSLSASRTGEETSMNDGIAIRHRAGAARGQSSCR
jgi:hypothetical protein